ncbi:MAG: hypothetical protein ACKOA9_00895, partial [Actinomycetota bacterium]
VVAGVLVAVAATVPAGVMPAVVSFLIGLVLVPLLASPLEWLVHRGVYHVPVLAPLRSIHKVHTAHHLSFFPTWRNVTEGPPRRLAISAGAPEVRTTGWANARVRLAHFCWYMSIGVVAIWVPAWLLTGNLAFLAGVVVSSAVVSNLFIAVHDTIHRPGSHRIIEAQPWYAFLDRHHYIHHVDLGANLNFLLPLADWLFGTLRTDLTPAEIATHGTLAAAKAHPVGRGGRAREEAAAVA